MDKTKKEERKINVVSPRTDDDFFAVGRLLLSHSTCLKTQSAALLVADGKIVSWGVNMCCPQEQLYGLPVTECLRMNAQTGTHYELCKPLHAEIVAAINAFGISHVERKTLWHFPGFTLCLKNYEGFFKNKNAILYLLGHYWACEECVNFLRLIGVSEIKFDSLSGAKTLQQYQTRKLTSRDHALDVSGCIVAGIVTVRIQQKEIHGFCERQHIDHARISVLKTGETNDFYLVEVAPGTEQEKANSFSKDPAVRQARVLITKSV